MEGLFGGAVGKDTVSRAWRKLQSAWAAWQRRDLAGEDIVRLILDGTTVKVRRDRKATSMSIRVAMGVLRDGQKVLLALRNMGGESEAAWRTVLDDLMARNMATPELLIVDGAPARRPRRCWPSARHSCANGGSNAAVSPTAWRQPAIGCSPCLGYPPGQWKWLRTTNAIERLHQAFKRRIDACCPRPRPRACCSGPCWPLARSRRGE